MEYISSQYAIHFTLPDGSVFVVDVDDNSYRYQEMMGKDELDLKFALPENVDFPIGTRCTFQGQEYYLASPNGLKVVNRRNYEYTMVLESYRSVLGKYLVHNMVDGRLQFDLTARPAEHLQQIIDNLNERDSGWSIGVCIDTDEKLITYNHTRCSEAMASLASTFGTEFEINGKTISLHKVEYFKDSPLEMSYGKGNGFKSGITRSNYDDSLPVERLFVQGGSQNIDRSRYALDSEGRNGSVNLLLPPAGTVLSFDGSRFSDEPGFKREGSRSYIVDSRRLSITRSDKPLSSYNEDSIDCSSIYPHRVGTVSDVKYLYHGEWYTYSELIANNPALASADWNNEESILIDFFDSGIEEGLDYESCKVAGEIQTVIFQSGMLAGREFNIARYHADTKRFEIVRAEIDGVLMPSNVFRLSPGDRYIIFNCTMPTSYYEQAEIAMFKEAIRYFYEHEDLRFSFTGEMDGIWAKQDWVNVGGKIRPGAYVLFNDIDLVDSSSHMVRIQSVKQYVNNPHSPVITLSNEPNMSVSTVGGTLKSLDDESVHIDTMISSTKNYARRSFKQAKETMDMLQGAIDGFTGGISPVTVQTMQMLVGDERLQFRFIKSLSNIQKADCPVSWDNEEKKLRCSESFIAHMTFGMENFAVSPLNSRTANDYARWRISSYESAGLVEELKTKAYYLYAICDIGENYPQEGRFKLSETSMQFNDGHLNLLVGILSSEDDGDRSFAPMYGYSEILPGQITTDLIKGSDGNSWWNLALNAFNLGDRLKYNINGDRAMVLNGTFTQTGSGEVTPIGAWCGEYSATRTYASGDEVWYNNNGDISTYRYVNSEPTRGKLPTDANYWIVIARGSTGSKGDKGQSSFKSIVFIRSTEKPDAPTGGSYSSPVPSGWSDGVPDGDYQLWMSTRVFTSDGLSPQSKEWTPPQPATDTSDIDFEYSALATNPGTPSSPSMGANWHNDATSSDIWMATRKAKNGVWGTWQVAKIKGENGADGKDGDDGNDGRGISSTEIKYGVGSNGITPPELWQDTVPTVSAGYYLWTKTTIYYTTGNPSVSYSVSRYGSDGVDGNDGSNGSSAKFLYLSSEVRPITPTGTNPNPYGWSTDPTPYHLDQLSRYGVSGQWTASSNRTWIANAIGHSNKTMATLSFTTTKNHAFLKLTCAVSTERTYDRLIIGNIDSEIICDPDNPGYDDNYYAKLSSETSGVQNTATYIIEIPRSGNHYIQFIYAKDRSASYVDYASFQLVELYSEYPVWMSQCNVLDGVASGWTTPIRISGENGNDGNDGAASVYRGNYNEDTKGNTVVQTYWGLPSRTDIVYYPVTGKYYRTNPAVCGSFSNIIPTNTAYWMEFGASFDNIATGFLFAEEATIENAVIRKLRTSEIGKRIFVEGDSMTMYDNDGNIKMFVSGDVLSNAISSDSLQLASSNFYEKTYDGSGSTSYQGRHNFGTLNIGNASNVVTLPKLSINAGFSAGEIEGGYIQFTITHYWTIDNISTGQSVVSLEGECNQWSTAASNSTYLPQFTTTLSPGQHTIGIMTIVTVNNYAANVYAARFLCSCNNGTADVVYPIQKTEVASNGFRTMFSSDYMFEASKSGTSDGTIIFKMLAGNYGVVVNSSGMYVRLNGTWYSCSYNSGNMKLTSTISPL